MYFELNIDAKPQDRPHVGKGGRVYYAKSTYQFRDDFAAELARAEIDTTADEMAKIYVSPITVSIDIFKPRNPSSRKFGDIDNICKAVLDALQNCDIIKDDSKVVALFARKFYDHNSSLNIEIQPVV